MAKIDRVTAVAEALDLLDEVGLAAVSTRALARRLAVQQPSLYWHFRTKDDLLAAMAGAAMAPHAAARLPAPGDDWHEWFLENHRSFRRTLLARRDGARLHAGSSPHGADLDRIAAKLAFLASAGVPDALARAGMLAASHFTVGSAVEEQASGTTDRRGADDGVPPLDHDAAFEAGLALILSGLIRQTEEASGRAGPADGQA